MSPSCSKRVPSAAGPGRQTIHQAPGKRARGAHAGATKEEKEQQIRNLRAFQELHRDKTPAALRRLQETAINGGNIFAELMETVKVASLGQISHALYEVGGKYRRNM